MSRLVKLMPVLSLLPVVLMEYVNSAIGAVVDRISLDPHPLSRLASDNGSVAVAVAVPMAFPTWLVMVGPVAAAWIAG